eukprot:751339-Hanusia_phi.AAC.3
MVETSSQRSRSVHMSCIIEVGRDYSNETSSPLVASANTVACARHQEHGGSSEGRGGRETLLASIKCSQPALTFPLSPLAFCEHETACRQVMPEEQTLERVVLVAQ